MNNKFPTLKELEKLGKLKSTGFTNGKDIFINFFSGSFNKNHQIELILHIVYIHEMIHCINMNLSEKEVFRGTELFINFLDQCGDVI